MDYKNKVKVEKQNIKVSTVANEFNMNGIVDSNIANVSRITTCDAITGGANPATISQTIVPYGGMVIDFLPSLGGGYGARRFQLAFKDQFVKVVGSAYSALSLNEVDLIKLAMYSEGLYCFICEIDRAIHTYDKFDKVNKAFGKFLIELQGFSWADIAQNRQRWIDERNVLAHIINEKFYLGKSTRLERHLTLSSKVFATDTNRKTQVIVFRPMEYVDIYSLTSWEIGLPTFTIPGNQGVTKTITLTSLSNLINSVRDASMSAWYDDVAPYLHHLYGDSDKDLYKIADYVDYDDFAIVYDSDVLTLIRNMRLVQSVYTDGTRATLDTHVYVTEDSAGLACQGGWAAGSYTNAAHAMVGCNDGLDFVSNVVVDIIEPTSYNVESFPATTEELFAAMLGRFQQNLMAGGGTGVPGCITYSTTTLFWGAKIAFSNYDDDGSITATQALVNLMCDGGTSSMGNTARCYNVGSLSASALATWYGNLAMFGVYPYMTILGGSYTSLVSINYHIDIDNEFEISPEVWRQYETAEVYESAKFIVPNFIGRK